LDNALARESQSELKAGHDAGSAFASGPVTAPAPASSPLQWLLAWQQIVEINEAHWAKSAKVFYNFSSLCSRQFLVFVLILILILILVLILCYQFVLLLALRHFRISANA